MKANKSQKLKTISAIWAILGVLFLACAIALYIMRDRITQIPRADIAYIGFLIVGAILLIIALAMYGMANDKNAIIEEYDERSQAITNKAGNFTFIVQTVVLSIALFLLCFMGYGNSIIILTLMSIVAISVIIYLLVIIYYKHKM